MRAQYLGRNFFALSLSKKVKLRHGAAIIW